MAARISSFVSTVQLRLKIEQATSTDDDPTPIYLLDEVAQMVGSSSKNIAEAVETIQHRLQHRTATVKQKALKLVKHVAQRGSPEFKRALARHSAAVRDLTHYRCSPDQFKGDIPWKRVQEYAREALETLHAAPTAQNASSSDPAVGVRIQGFGNDSGGGSSGLIGFGSESQKNISPRGGMVGFGGGLSANGGGGGTHGPESMLNSFSSGVRGLTDRAMGALTRPEHRLINSMDSDFDSYDSYGMGSAGAGGSSGRLPTQIVHESPGEPTAGTAAAQRQASSPEQKLVDRICTPSGLRVAPGSEDLKAFVTAASGMDGIHLATALQKKLETGSWQEILRALCAIEAMLEKSTSPASGEMAVHFQFTPTAVRRARQSTQTTVRDRAERVLRLLGDDTLPVDRAPKPMADLLGGESSEVNASTESATAQKGNAVDLLGELEISQPAPLAATGADDFLSSLAGPSAPVVTAVASAPIDDLFGAWTDSAPQQTNPGAAVFTQQATAGATSPSSAGFDLLGGLSELSLGGGLPPSSGIAPAPLSSLLPPAPKTSLVAPAPEIDFSFAPTLQPMQPGYGQAASMQPLAGFGVPPSGPPPLPGGVGGGFGVSSLTGTNSGSLGGPLAGNDVLSAINAATSGITSTKREDAAFNFVQGTMDQLKKK